MANNAAYFRTLRGWQQALKQLPNALMNDGLKDASEQLKGELVAGHSAGTDPYGNPWKARKHSYPWPILDKTGRTKGSYTVKATKKGINARNTSSVAGYHQRGTRYLAIRLLVPTSKRGLPATWSTTVSRELGNAFNRTLKK